jgi:hypothetical protein
MFVAEDKKEEGGDDTFLQPQVVVSAEIHRHDEAEIHHHDEDEILPAPNAFSDAEAEAERSLLLETDI